VLAWGGHRLYTTVYADAGDELWFAIRGTLFSGLLFLIFALYEFQPSQKWKSLIVVVIWLMISFGIYAIPVDVIKPRLVFIAAAGAGAVGAGLLVRALKIRHGGVVVAAAALGALACGLLVLALEGRAQPKFVLEQSHVPQFIIGGILATLVLLLFLGAPYHLINTTVNLVSSSDVAIQQRFTDCFIMSKQWCGSMRAGYRSTEEYACGTISLGTAMAASGVAPSPKMSTQPHSAAFGALLAVFNVRLGYWAPTPNQSYWRTPSLRLWPVFAVQEWLSQNTALLPFCRLTDGGHFDNSGVYSLIQRGCRFIVYADCGADPNATLDDIGNLIRKVRIDFGTEIEFDDAEIAKLRTYPRGTHHVKGTVRYSKIHADALGLQEDERTTTIVIIKPNIAGGEPVDVLQYSWTFTEFPQQSTADQWYDEAQFESYRQLGYLSGQNTAASGVFGTVMLLRVASCSGRLRPGNRLDPLTRLARAIRPE
jgi:hypothetical protein